MANTFLGVGVTFGVAGTTGITGSGIGTFTLQTQKHSKHREMDMVRDAVGTEVQGTLYNPTEEASFDYVASGATTALAATATSIPDMGTLVTVSAASPYAAIGGTTWFVMTAPEISFSNVGSAKVTLALKRWLGTNGISAVTT